MKRWNFYKRFGYSGDIHGMCTVVVIPSVSISFDKQECGGLAFTVRFFWLEHALSLYFVREPKWED